MNFFLACFAWLFIAAFLGAGILLMAIKGSIWLLALAVISTIIAVWHFGCKAH